MGAAKPRGITPPAGQCMGGRGAAWGSGRHHGGGGEAGSAGCLRGHAPFPSRRAGNSRLTVFLRTVLLARSRGATMSSYDVRGVGGTIPLPLPLRGPCRGSRGAFGRMHRSVLLGPQRVKVGAGEMVRAGRWGAGQELVGRQRRRMAQEEQRGRYVSSPRPWGLRVPGTLGPWGSLVPVPSPEGLAEASGFLGAVGPVPWLSQPLPRPQSRGWLTGPAVNGAGNSSRHPARPESVTDGLVSEVGDLAPPGFLPPASCPQESPWPLPPPCGQPGSSHVCQQGRCWLRGQSF